MQDEEWMRRALDLAKKGQGWVNPNPLVGAVIVKDGRLIGQGYHGTYGQAHAEREALAACTEDPEGATLYVNLEPCCHYGKTPPCTEAVIASGIQRVVVGALDPHDKVAGKGVQALKEAGLAVEVGVVEADCHHLNRVFEKYIVSQRPYLVAKYAMTLDGKIATRTGQSRWVTGPEARQRVHQTRHALAAIMVGVNTVLADDPQLTCRIEGGKDPVRVICDSKLRTPLSSRVVQTANQVPTYLATTCLDADRQAPYREAGCGIIELGQRQGHLDLVDLMDQLGQLGLDSVLLEAGGTLTWSALDLGLVDEVHSYIAPKLFGGQAMSPVAGQGVAEPDQAIQLEPFAWSQVGADYLIESKVVTTCLPD
ncbi:MULTISPECIES: bifunctional diaminohydroxyphosphoribosylaminopyrimidine deaminase/5-amino-6-(5-phosphoribosylamino)uracil reductase RibD [Aerococcus]|uniref:Riboflavin biosynthesis protein RibD n=1 Tax=Aerococcus sanguinicola TaxID=119206 RepID=A0A5N1GPP3_9LACT|nr:MULTISPECIES: bifunctional diaminohydroxyphosphoribosylaminopyrimidine deaminase/5-amino-6-(5-phosphoribosylamino)uracil reductase RibD [Aerococcus]KAA9302198.1 bifunctional diaminohydroxyphosphoribosylaminopyrimidine deaminase/5-amino-6-(5-phosphoribosylamino)uracil reductase RibD [Aerococcus sanguinicola]MDK6368372.1 bifunctional diaminohydroxyphosphoribosylaminopyrimidine deaminase/5-amino-6-(5-phosphoribosylamino)uracil reductase RibD [Aerococcus sp. UMB9870]MDK6679454.1 bifunctional diam